VSATELFPNNSRYLQGHSLATAVSPGFTTLAFSIHATVDSTEGELSGSTYKSSNCVQGS
jgi:hypothetical protein